MNVRVHAGPAASFVVNKSIENGGLNGPVIKDENLNSVNWSIQAGAGVDVWRFALDIRYQVGLSQMIKDVKDVEFNSKNNVWVISLGFKII